MRKKHEDDTMSSLRPLTRFLTDHRSEREQPATTTVTQEGDATLLIASHEPHTLLKKRVELGLNLVTHTYPTASLDAYAHAVPL